MKTYGGEIHGGEIHVCEQADGMYRHLPLEVRRQREATLAAAVRTAYPWAPKDISVAFGQTNRDYLYYLSVTMTVPDRIREQAVKQRLAAAENTRCACGDYGSWEASISGTSGVDSCVWAGCPNCSGSAVGRPILASDLAWYDRRNRK